MDAESIAQKIIADWLCWDVGAILHPTEVQCLEDRIVREIEKALEEDRALPN